MLADDPGKAQRRFLFRRRCPLGRDLNIRRIAGVIRGLHDQATRHVLQRPRVSGGDVGQFEQPKIPPALEYGERVWMVARSQDALHEPMPLNALHDRLRRLGIDLLVQPDDAAEGRYRVGGQSVAIRLGERCPEGGAAGAVVLHYDSGRLCIFTHKSEHSIQVQIVVEGERLAVELPRRPKPHRCTARPTVEGGLLVWVFAVAKICDTLERINEEGGEQHCRVGLAGEVVVDGGVVAGGVSEGLDGEPGAGGVRHLAARPLHLFQHRCISRRIADDDHRLVVLRRRPEHRWAADVYVLYGVGDGDVRLRYGLLERVEIDHDQIDERDPVTVGRSHVLRVVAESQKPAMNLRMERLHAPVHHLGEAGVLRNIAHIHSRIPQVGRGAARGHDCDPKRSQSLRELRYAHLVRYTDESGANAWHDAHLTWGLPKGSRSISRLPNECQKTARAARQADGSTARLGSAQYGGRRSCPAVVADFRSIRRPLLLRRDPPQGRPGAPSGCSAGRPARARRC